MAQEPLGFRCLGFSPRFARTHSGILTSGHSTGRFATPASLLPERSPTPLSQERRPSFGGPLNPDHSRRGHAGLVSYYALFKGMAASKPTSQLSPHAHILRYTQRPLRGLSCGSGFFPSRRRTLSLGDCLPGSIGQVFGVWLGLVPASPARAHPVALPPADTSRGSTSIDFGENQLSPGLIGLSPLPTGHPSGFQPTPVRASTACYRSFTLLMGRSPWLRVCTRVLQFALVSGLAFALAPLDTSLASHPSSNSPDHNAKGTQSADIPSENRSLLLPLVGMWFQALFHSPHWGAFHLSLTVLVHYRSHGSL